MVGNVALAQHLPGQGGVALHQLRLIGGVAGIGHGDAGEVDAVFGGHAAAVRLVAHEDDIGSAIGGGPDGGAHHAGVGALGDDHAFFVLLCLCVNGIDETHGYRSFQKKCPPSPCGRGRTTFVQPTGRRCILSPRHCEEGTARRYRSRCSEAAYGFFTHRWQSVISVFFAPGETDCHSQCAHWLRNDRVTEIGCAYAMREKRWISGLTLSGPACAVPAPPEGGAKRTAPESGTKDGRFPLPGRSL